jgi:hypothetical protein
MGTLKNLKNVVKNLTKVNWKAHGTRFAGNTTAIQSDSQDYRRIISYIIGKSSHDQLMFIAYLSYAYTSMDTNHAITNLLQKYKVLKLNYFN